VNEVLELLALRFGLVTIRVVACIAALPVLGPMANQRVKATFVVILSMVLTAALPQTMAPPPMELLPLMIGALGEVMMGLAIGTCARLIMLAGEFAGELIGVPMGMGFMQVVDPLTGGQLVVTSRIFLTLSVLVFTLVGGHHSVIMGLASSFHAWPLGRGIPSGDMGWYVNHLAGSILRAGISLAAPVVVSILAIKVGLGIIARAAPRVQVFFIGFAFATLVGVAVLITTMPEIIALIATLTFDLNGWLAQLFEEVGA
jgi:flagellar biosynthesis protein FliR